MMSELDKLMCSFYVGKFCVESDCYLQDSIRMSFNNAKMLIDKKRNDEPLADFKILGVADY